MKLKKLDLSHNSKRNYTWHPEVKHWKMAIGSEITGVWLNRERLFEEILNEIIIICNNPEIVYMVEFRCCCTFCG